MPIADKMIKMVESSSMIRKMFEEGNRLKAKYGADHVFDFSIGNPDVPPPPAFHRVLRELAADDTLGHGYMPNPGHPQVRQAVADFLSRDQGVDITPEMIVMTVGAAGALNDAFKALVNPEEEILVPSPYFVGYNQYAFCVNAVLKTVPTLGDFRLDLAGIEKAITAKTRIMLINSPNNPTGVIYSAEALAELGGLLDRASKRFNKRIYLISDEPYRKIAYDVEVPSAFKAYPHTIVINSYSKELSLAGERIGYLAVHPEAEDALLVVRAASVANGMLCVNAPSLLQFAVARLQGVTVDISIYKRRRDTFCSALKDAGYDLQVPEGAFYLFPKSPTPDDVRFTQILMDELILVVPGSGFGAPGHFRISYAVPDSAIEGSLEGFKRALSKV